MSAAKQPYVTVTYDEADEFDDNATFGAWVRLKVIADGAYPMRAPIPRWCKSTLLKRLASRIEVVADTYRIPEMDAAREQRSDHAAVAARGRWDASRTATSTAASNAPSNAPSSTPSSPDSNAQTMPLNSAQLNSAQLIAKQALHSAGVKGSENGISTERADVQALIDGGWTTVSDEQRAILDRIADEHEGDFAWVATVVGSTPRGNGVDYLAAVREAHTSWLADREREAELRRDYKRAERTRIDQAYYRHEITEADHVAHIRALKGGG